MRETRDYLESLLNYANAPIIVWDPAFTISQFNHAFERLSGYEAGEVIGKDLWMLFPTESVEASLNLIRSTLTGERWESVEIPILRKDGSIRIALWNSANVQSEHGELLATIAQGQDITERKQAEDALRESKAMLEAVFSSMNDGVIIFDADGRAISANEAAARFHRFTDRDDFFMGLGSYAEMFVACNLDGTPLDPNDWPVSRALRGEVVYNQEMVVTRRETGESWTGNYSAAPIRGKGGSEVAAVVTMRDVTERKRAEAELADEKARAELYVDLMGHDINNMNQIAMGYLELIASNPELDPDLRRTSSTALRAVRDSSRLIANVRKLQRERLGEYKPDVYDLGVLVEGVAEEFKYVKDRYVNITCGAIKGVRVRANELLKDVFINLIGNSIKHSSGPVFIQIRMNPEERRDGRRYCTVTVDDNGRGVPDDMKERIFDRLRRGDTKAKGTGLGLYLVKSLVESYGGRVWVEDKVKGDHTKGARFVVMLPTVDN